MWFALYLVLDAAIVGLMYLMSTSGGIGSARNIWIVGAIFLAGALYAATTQARKPLQQPSTATSGRTPPAPAPTRQAKPRSASSPSTSSKQPAPSHRNGRKRH